MTNTRTVSPKKRGRPVGSPAEPGRQLKAYEPGHPRLVAALICTIAAATLLWPLFGGQILFGGSRSDMFVAGYAFRLFGAETFKHTGSIPQWNPYIFGGLPYIAAMHGDIFYPTAWLRWIMPVDLAITWGMAVHFILAGWFTYVFVRALGIGWSGAVLAAVSYELTGIIASQMSPGHDGKLFVSALTPLSFWILVLAIRERKSWAYGVFAIVVGLTVLGHYNMSYFLLIALGLWTLYLTFWDDARPRDVSPWIPLCGAFAAVVVGIGITSLQIIPFLDYIKYSPRAEGGPDTGWAFATSYAFPPRELFTVLLPQLNGILDHYWGQNPIKFHTEYMGALPLMLAGVALGDQTKRRLVLAMSVCAILFLLFAFGGYSPLYKLLFGVMPYLSKIRAMGMVFFLTAFPICVLAAIGFERVLDGTVPRRTVVIVASCVVAFALLGAVGALQPIAESLAIPERAEAVRDNATDLQYGALRLLLFAVLGGGAVLGTITGHLKRPLGVWAVILIAVLDLWSLDRQFFVFSPRANVLFRDDAITSYLRRAPKPYRVLDAGSSYGQTSILMGYGIPQALGYHGFELRSYDELGGRASGWQTVATPNFLDLLAVRYLILAAPQTVPGFHQVVGLTTTAIGNPGVLLERDSVVPYARVVLTAAKVSDDSEISPLLDPRFPLSDVALFSDTSSVRADSLTRPLPRSNVRARVSAWAPGSMTITLDGRDVQPGHVLVSENWYPDWHAVVDGKEAMVRRADHTLLSVDIPPGSKEVRLWFAAADYAWGKVVSAISLIVAAGMIGAGLFVDRHRKIETDQSQ
ncbi:MAG TPA: hypothetical protein VJO33_16890 [Gemmatimonadaceae bacterium]|nr:hypothetical protein [Gemmatimonadaceae bacterium]